MTTDTIVSALSAEDVAALRMADTVTFHHYQGCAFIRAYVRPSGHPATRTQRAQILFPEGPETSGERAREIPVSGSISGYTERGSMWHVDRTDTDAAAFHWIHSAHFVPTWVTVAQLLAAGETLTLLWIADNNSQDLRNAGLHHDALEIKAVKGKRTRVYKICDQVTLDNSARMIRRHGK
jgi:hypothetical protein